MQRTTQYRFASLRNAKRKVGIAVPTWTALTTSPRTAKVHLQPLEWVEPLRQRLRLFERVLSENLGLRTSGDIHDPLRAALSVLITRLVMNSGLADVHLISLPEPANPDDSSGQEIKVCLVARYFAGNELLFVRTRDRSLYEIDAWEAPPRPLPQVLADDLQAISIHPRRAVSLATMARLIPRRSVQRDKQLVNTVLGCLSADVPEIGGCTMEILQLLTQLVLDPLTDINQAALQRLACHELPSLPTVLATERLSHTTDHIAFGSCGSIADVVTRKQAFRTYPALRLFARGNRFEKERSAGLFRFEKIPIRAHVERRDALRAIDLRVPLVKELSRIWDCPKWAARFALTIPPCREAGSLDMVAWHAARLSADCLPKNSKDLWQFFKIADSALQVHIPSLVAREVLANGNRRLLRIIDDEQLDNELTDYLCWLLNVDTFLRRHKTYETCPGDWFGTLEALDAADSIPSLLKLSKRWHEAEVQIAGSPEEGVEGPGEWAPLFPDVVQIEDFEFRALATREQLRAEGVAMKHCVGGYGADCLLGVSNIISITRGGERVATADIHVSIPDESANVVATLKQISGARNAAADSSIKAAVSKLVAAICNGEVVINPRMTKRSHKITSSMDQLELDVLRVGENAADWYAPALAFKGAKDEYPTLFRRAVRNLLREKARIM